jgi:hypothetical protein
MFLAIAALAILKIAATEHVDKHQQFFQATQKKAEKLIFDSGSIQVESVLAGWARNPPNSNFHSSDAFITHNTAEFSDTAKLTAAEGTITGEFGTSVALDGDTLIVGAPFEKNTMGERSGSAYIFVRGAAG